MANTIKILEWNAKGLRCPDHRIRFETTEGRVHPVSLIQMPNGTGKTTTLQLLRAALSGADPTSLWGQEGIMSLAKDAGGRTPTGEFSVVVLIDSHRYTFTIKFNFDESKAELFTTTPLGNKKGFHIPGPLVRLFNQKFVELFVFDGELADELLDATKTRADIAVDNLFQLNNFSQMISRLNEDWDDRVRDKTAKEDKGLERRRNRVQRLRARIKLLREQRSEIKKKTTSLSESVSRRTKAYEAELEQKDKDKEALSQLKTEFERIRGELKRRTDGVLEAVRNPVVFRENGADEIVRFKEALDKAKLPEKAAKEFFEELARESHCICGRPIDEESRDYIRNHASHYLGSEEHSLLNAIKEDISLYLVTPTKSPYEEIRERLKILADVRSSYNATHTLIVLREEELRHGDPHLEAIHSELKKDEEELAKLSESLKKFDDSSDVARDEDTYGVEVLDRRLQEAEKQLEEATETARARRAIRASIAILQAAHTKARYDLAKVVVEEANDRIRSLMPDNSVFIDKLEGNLQLKGKAKGSAGENLSVAYAFLSTIFNNSDHQLPFVVDSPAGPIDLSIRPQIAKLIPRLSKQFIAFTISSERQNFSSELDNNEKMRADVQFLTLFRHHGTPHALADSVSRVNKVNVARSNDGFLIEDLTFFNSFQLDTED